MMQLIKIVRDRIPALFSSLDVPKRSSYALRRGGLMDNSEQDHTPILISSMDVNKLVERAYRAGWDDHLAFSSDDLSRDSGASAVLGRLLRDGTDGMTRREGVII